MTKRMIIALLGLLPAALHAPAQDLTGQMHPDFKVITDTSKEPVAPGPYLPTVESLSSYECPDWFRDAKFGIWAHWGPQCQPEDGDWYGRLMYIRGENAYRYNIDTKGHPSEFGFKDWIGEWKAENWDPDSLVRLYKEAGARYFMALANHHDNFDLYDSRYQSWNSTVMGPEKDIIGGWAGACRREGLKFGVSVHAAHSWTWYEPARGSDDSGPLKGVPYDGVLQKEDGAGKWWEGFDPQELYEQRHPLSPDNGAWNWEEDKVTVPDQAFCDKIYNRTAQLITDYRPDVVYFDDTYLPLWPVSDAGLNLLAHAYNSSIGPDGRPQTVLTGKVLNDWQKKTLVWDVERGVPGSIQPLPWQTCTCIGSWHYDKHIYYDDWYKSAAQVIGMLVDIVSKNGNLLLSIPLKGDGTLDPTELGIVRQIGRWMKINGESIYETRPWVIYGEGPIAEAEASPLKDQGFNEGTSRPGAKDIRFNKKGEKILYATIFGVPEEPTVVHSLGSATEYNKRRIKKITLLGSGTAPEWEQKKDCLTIGVPAEIPSPEALVYKIEFR